jgi:hypothetical protein
LASPSKIADVAAALSPSLENSGQREGESAGKGEAWGDWNALGLGDLRKALSTRGLEIHSGTPEIIIIWRYCSFNRPTMASLRLMIIRINTSRPFEATKQVCKQSCLEDREWIARIN